MCLVDICSLLFLYEINRNAQVLYKYNEDTYNQIQETFDCLPLAATIAGPIGKFFCVHGGLSPDVQSVREYCGGEGVLLCLFV